MEEEPPEPHPFFREVRVRYARLAEEVLQPRRLGGLRRWLAQGPAEVARWGPLPEVALCVEDAPPPSAGAAGGGAAGAGGATLDERDNRAKAVAIALTAWQGLLRGIGLAGGGGRPPAAALAREMLRHPWLARRAGDLSQAAREALARMPGGFALAGRTPKLLPGHDFRTHYYIRIEAPKLLALAGAAAANGDLRDARRVLAFLDGCNALMWMGPGDFADGARNPRRAVFDFFAGAALDALGAKGDPDRFRAVFPDAERRGARAPQAWLEAAEALGGPRVGAVRALLAGRGALFARWGPPSGAA